MSTNDTGDTDERLARFWKRRPLLLLSFAIIVTLTVFFGARTVVHFADWRGHHAEQIEVRAWMRPTYIARTWRIDRMVVFDAIGIEAGSPDQRLSLAQIARRQGVPVSQLISDVEDAIARSPRQDPV